MRLGFSLTLLICAGFVPAGAEEAWDACFGTAGAAAVSGNGGLTAAVDAAGRLVSLRWPSPGYHDQLACRARDGALPAAHGAYWAFRVADTLYRLDAPPWTPAQGYRGEASTAVVSTGSTDNGIAVEQTVFVHATEDVLAARLVLTGLDTAPRIFWLQNLAPCTRKLPEAPVADWLLDAANDFAAYHDEREAVVYHFRPEAPGRDAWEKARYLSETGAGAWSWSVFGAGVWSALGTANPPVLVRCAPVRGTLAALEADALAPSSAASGHCQVLVELDPMTAGGRYEAVVFLAFGPDREGAGATLRSARDRGFDTLLRETEEYWQAWLGRAGLTLENNPDESRRRRALLNIAQATDRETGAIVAAPITQPPRAVVLPRATAWATRTLDEAGFHEEAARALRFLAAGVRTEGDASPHGSLPAALYSDGVPAAPAGMVRADGGGWLLSALWRHAGAAGAEPEVFLTEVWPDASAAAGFLARWVVRGTGEPWPSFQPRLLRDGRGLDALLLARLGLDCAVRMADALGETPPGLWERTLGEFEARLRFRAANQENTGTPAPVIDPGLPLWLHEFVAPEDRAWELRAAWEETTLPLRAFTPPAGPADGLGVVPASLEFLAATARIYTGR